MYVRKLTGALRPKAVKELVAAEAFAKKRGKPLNRTLTIHPKLLDTYPDDVGHWLGWLTNKIRIHCERAGFGYFALWVRENYEGDRREHIHMLLHLPEAQFQALEHNLRCWLPGAENAIDFGYPEFIQTRYGRVNKAVTYMLKQMTPQAWAALGRQVRREKKSRDDHSPVAPVLGKRHGISRSLNANSERAFWTAAHLPSARRIRIPMPAGVSSARA